MAKSFRIVKKQNLVTGEEQAVRFAAVSDEEAGRLLLRKLNRSLSETEAKLFAFRYDEKLCMHLLPGLSQTTVRELSRQTWHTAYAVCKKRQDRSEKVLYLSLFKDTALRFKAAIPAAIIHGKDGDVLNPNYYVRELRRSS